MTRERWAELNLDQQRIKVAELCGWQEIHIDEWCGSMWGYPAWWKPHMIYRKFPVPDYVGDLNAMHEAESKACLGGNAALYEQNLRTIMLNDEKTWHPWHANASQRAEAFALTMEPEPN